MLKQLLMIDLFESSNYSDDFNKINFLDIEHFFIDDLLVKNDRMFLANAVELRVSIYGQNIVQ